MAAHVGTSADRTTTGDVKRAIDFCVSDFATIVTTTAYVDKSLMIRDVYNASSRILITAPRRFGKSTNLDMVKRFFEIEVDELGNPNTVHTNNYKLFKDYNLEICKDVGFFNEHFGKHPVVHIDFKPLGRVYTSAKVLDAFKMIVKNSFNQHNYILQNSLKEQVFNVITGFDENDFRKYVSGGITKDVDEVNLANSFNHLSTILKMFFGKKVFVLIDSYDAFLDSPLFENSTDREKMMSFVESSVGQLLNNVKCVDRVFITGVIPVIGEGFLWSGNNIECYHFLDSHPFTKYYGLTSVEVDTVLSKIIECDEERRDVRNTINDYYNAYETRNRGIRVYNVWSVLQYVYRRQVQSYWCERRYINELKKCFKIEPIRQKLEYLLLGNELELDISQPLSIADVLKVNSMITSGEAKHLSVEVESFVVFIYHSGYLSVIDDLGMGVVFVNIPSEEIKYEVAKAILDENMQLYSSPDLDDMLSALDAVCPDSTGLHNNMNKYFGSIDDWNEKNKIQITYIFVSLFMNLVTRRKNSRVVGRKLWPDGPIAVLLKNKHQVAICVTGHGGQSAESTHQKVTNDRNREHIFDAFNDVRGKVIIAVGLVNNEQMEIVYSYYIKTGDDLRTVYYT